MRGNDQFFIEDEDVIDRGGDGHGLNGGYSILYPNGSLKTISDGLFEVLTDKVRRNILSYCYNSYFIELDDIFEIIKDGFKYHVDIDYEFLKKFDVYQNFYKRAFYIIGMVRHIDDDIVVEVIKIMMMILSLSRVDNEEGFVLMQRIDSALKVMNVEFDQSVNSVSVGERVLLMFKKYRRDVDLVLKELVAL